MSDTIVAFLHELGRRGYEPLLGGVSGTALLEVVDGGGIDAWLVTIDKGAIEVSHERGAADCTVRAERAFFDRLARGEENAIAAVLRGELVCGGDDVELLFQLQRVLPGPPRQARGAP